MAYFNHSFNKTFVVGSVAGAGVATSALTAGQFGLVDGPTWTTVAVAGGAPAITGGDLGYLVQGSFYTKDTIGNNPGHGGYKESVKSKGINPRYITELWGATCQTATQATAKLCLASDCAPCGKTQFARIDVKGSPALRFLNHNAYAIADSSNVCCVDGQEYLDPALILGRMVEMLIGNGLATSDLHHVAGDPLITPFVAEGDVDGLLKGAGLTLTPGTGYAVAATQLATSAVDANGSAVTSSSRPGFVNAKVVVTAITGGGGTGPIAANGYTIAQAGAGYVVGDVVTIATGGANGKLTVAAGGAGLTVGGVVVTSTTAAGVASDTVYTVAQAVGVAGAGNYTPSTDPNGATKVSACVTLKGAYVDTVFGNCSFDTRDHYNAEPVEIILSSLDETGNPCNDCGVASRTPGMMQQTQGEEVIRELIMSERYRQSPYNQGNADSSRIREIELSDELLAAVDRTATYRAYYVKHSVPRFNNPTGVFDNDQYVYKIYIKCSDAALKTAMDNLMGSMSAWANANYAKVPFTTNSYW